MQPAPGQRGQGGAPPAGGRGQAAQAARGGGGGGRGNRPPAPEVPPEFDATPIMAINDEDELIAMVSSPSSTFFQKAIACKRLYMIGTRKSIPAVAAHLGEEHLGHYARFVLEPMPDPQVDVVFREALGRLKGPVLVGVLTSIGVRRDPAAVEPVAALMTDGDVDVARAAAATLGTISGRAAAELLMGGQSRVSAEVRPVWARAALVCADRMAADEPRMAMDIYNTLNSTSYPKPVMLAARRRIMAAGI